LDQSVDKKGDPPMPVPANAPIGDSKARGGSDIFPFWKTGHATALRDLAGEKESTINEKSDKLDAPPAITATAETGTARQLNDKDEAQTTLDNADVSTP
jgi:hypothetical protein